MTPLAALPLAPEKGPPLLLASSPTSTFRALAFGTIVRLPLALTSSVRYALAASALWPRLCETWNSPKPSCVLDQSLKSSLAFNPRWEAASKKASWSFDWYRGSSTLIIPLVECRPGTSPLLELHSAASNQGASSAEVH
jgi:hypothetical protein